MAKDPLAAEQLVQLAEQRDVVLAIWRAEQVGRPPGRPTFSDLAHERPIQRAGLGQCDPRGGLVEQRQNRRCFSPLRAVPARAGDRLLLCSDGITDYLTDDQIFLSWCRFVRLTSPFVDSWTLPLSTPVATTSPW